MEALRAAGLDRAFETDVSQSLTNELGDAHDGIEGGCRRRIEIEDEVGDAVETFGADQRGVVLDGALVGEPQQRAPVVAQRIGHVPLRRLGPERDRRHPLRVYFGTFFCMNGCSSRCTRITDSGRSVSARMRRSAKLSR